MACSLASVLLVSASAGASGQITEFPVPAENGNPVGITAGPDGNLWFCERGGNRIGRITPQGSISEFPTESSPNYITAGPDGNLWFTEFDGSVFDYGGVNIGRISPSGELKEFPLPGGLGACGIAAGSDGNLWFTTCTTAVNQIGRITAGGTITLFSIKGVDLYPADLIAAGPDGNLWFTEPYAARIGRITTAGLVTEFKLPSDAGFLSSIVAGPGGDLWFATGINIGRITTGGDITEFAVQANLLGLGPDGNLWFVNGSSNSIGRLSITAGGVEIGTDFPVPAYALINGITSGPDGNLWFTESNRNKIGRVDISHVCPVNVLCLGDRFQITAAWEGGGSSGTGAPVVLTANAGYFSFFGSSNVEVFVKILDACAASGNFNVYVNGLTHLGVTVTVTDTRTGTSKQYVNPMGSPFSLIFDGSTFACP
jgi:streptogramin lyase